MSRNTLRLFMAALFIVCLLQAACSKVTKDNYEKIKNEMTLSEVEAFLGQGSKQGDGSGAAGGLVVQDAFAGKSGAETYVWESDGKSITVYFTAGKVKNKTSRGF